MTAADQWAAPVGEWAQAEPSTTAGLGAEPETTTSTSPSTTSSSTTRAPTTTTTAPTTTATPSTSPTSAVPAPPGADTSTTTSAPEATTTTAVAVEAPGVAPAVTSTSIPLGSVLFAVVVLAVVGVLAVLAARRHRAADDETDDDTAAGEIADRGAPEPGEGGTASPREGAPGPDGTAPDAGGAATAPVPPLGEEPTIAVASAAGAAARRAVEGRHAGPSVTTLRFLLEIGRALIDAGDPVDDVESTIRRVGEVNGVHGLGVVVLPTALMISVPGSDDVQTEVSTAGRARLRLDQIDEVFEVVKQAEEGHLRPAEGLVALLRVRDLPAANPPQVRLVGAVLFTLGPAMMLRSPWPDLALAVVLGLGVGAFQLLVQRRSRRPGVANLQAFWPLVAAFAVSIVVFSVSRTSPDLTPYAPIVAGLVTFLPGGLLTTGVMELATGSLISGSGRLAAGLFQLALLATGIVAAAQLVGVPATTIGEDGAQPLGAAVAWLGVGTFGAGVFLFHGGRRASLGWTLLVLYVAYAGQVVGGALFGGSLSAFFGALAMTPFAVYGSRQAWGPSMLVSFLPAFWLLVPGALGLEGITQFLGGDEDAGLDVLLATGSTMLGVALGVLLGSAVAASLLDRDWRALRVR